MNILTDTLPDTITISNTEYKVRSDFRTCLNIIRAFEDESLTPQEKQILLLSMLFVVVPHDVQQAVIKGNEFLNGGETREVDEQPLRLYSFEKDARFIYAAFKATHGIDLQKEDLHWWQFLSLFMDLGQDTTFCQLVGLRKRVKTGKATKDEKIAADEMGDLFLLEEFDTRTLEEKEMLEIFDRKVKEAEQRRNNG